MTRAGLVAVVCGGLMMALACGSPAGAGGAVRAPAGSTWQYQLQGPVDTSVDAATYDVDLFGTSAQTVAALHADGRQVVCYVNAGAVEDWRPDAGALPAEVRGQELEDWPDEYWLDVRRTDVLEPWLAARFDLCKQKGFDAVEPDNVDGYTHPTGFPLGEGDQLAFNLMLARLAHERGLAVGLKNDLDQVDDLVGDFDFAVNEQCAQYRECDALAPFVAAGKPVYHVEYDLPLASFCPPPPGFRSIRKNIVLDAPVETCPAQAP
ncbi:endo alpha-1,4 polygalactosaminidase [Actinomycetospora sp. NBRC 106375]|uniref:endo alpha-1,4 polygalactosaminidase n=1 Tax=Actinomycetospora sp. NBRC 106375 TaxID=3032207 RepID=UPI0024A2FCD8|nr:endo alpha-1,4 polygalactosaminidase [Actinomycetospora sp. NBRC 106375]GLZ49115.1 endo alpha-1,4 polygalactosaminidase [Actinomycetospora sp. NBRC 106375]